MAATRSNPKNWFPPELAVAFNVSCTIELLTWWLRQTRPVPMERVAEIHARIIMTPSIEADRHWTQRLKMKRNKHR